MCGIWRTANRYVWLEVDLTALPPESEQDAWASLVFARGDYWIRRRKAYTRG